MLHKIKVHLMFLLLIILTPSIAIAEGINKTFLSLERTIQTDTDITITSIGAFGITNEKIGHFNLSFLETNSDGDALALDFGAGGGKITGSATIYLGLGFLLRYNNSKRDFTAAPYPEAGVAFIIKKNYGINFSAKRYFNFYGRAENVILLGLLYNIE